jgi:predicted nucleic acid-binding protein
MPEYLIDTWYLIAALDPFDTHHRAAQGLHARLRGVYVTHYGVLTELLAFVSGGGTDVRQRAVDAVRHALREFKVLPLDSDLFYRALTLYERRRDKEYSLVDCVSMVIMRDRNITTILTNDRHFAQEGFTLLNA